VELVSLADIRQAAYALAGVAVHTPLLPCPWAPGELYLKPETLQPVGAFKLRGAYYAMSALPEQQRATGVVTHSSGNHARALAYAANLFGVRCVVVMPDTTPPSKVAAVRALHAGVVIVPPAERLSRASALAEQHGLTMIPPFDHHDVIAGQGTVGLEILADQLEVEQVLVPVGGGGLAAGVVTAIKTVNPQISVYGVEPALAADAAESLNAGELRIWPDALTQRTVADGLRTALSPLTFAHLHGHLDGIITVSEDEIYDAVTRLALDARIIAEPSGAVAVAGYLHHRDRLAPGRTVAVVTGGNIEPTVLAALIAPGRESVGGG
jgi:threonine dehydratase